MIESVILGLMSLLPGGQTDLTWSENLTLHSGNTVIELPHKANAVGLEFTNTVSPITVETNNETRNLISHHDKERFTNLQFFKDSVKTLTFHTPEKVSFRAHYYYFHPEKFETAQGGILLGNGKNAPKFYTRADWGADESLRVWKPGRGIASFFRASAPESRKLPKEQKPKVIKRKNDEGKRLTWPLAQSQQLKKFVIHHTAEHIDETRNPMTLIRAIYSYHTLTRGWGDIGYHYLIDKKGNVYEGRAGGASIVAAHTAYYNVGTVGISLMGNFDREQPTEDQIKSLSILMAEHASRYNIDLQESSAWLHAHSHNITSHREVAATGHGTACPGRNLQRMLPEIRLQALAAYKKMNKGSSRSRDALSRHSQAAPKIRGKIEREVIPEVALAEIREKETFRRGDKRTISVKIRNGTQETWPKGSYFKATNRPDGLWTSKFIAQDDIPPLIVGTFTAYVNVTSAANGEYNLTLKPRVPGISFKADDVIIPLQISGSADFLTKDFKNAKGTTIQANSFTYKPRSVSTLSNERFKTAEPEKRKPTEAEVDNQDLYGPDVKIKLSYFDEKFATISSSSTLQLIDRNKVQYVLEPNTKISLRRPSEKFDVTWNGETKTFLAPMFKTIDANGVIKIENYNRGLGPSNPYNQFRRQLNFHKSEKGKFIIVNELPLEKYLYGLAEEPSTEPTEKKHAIHVLARSYVYVYSSSLRKFQTHLYDLEDSPRTSQFYLGYDWERYHAEQRSLVEETKGVVLSHNNQAVIGPYFTQSSGQSSSKWVSQYPWTIGRDLPYDKGLPQKGHGVGLSGNSARRLAQDGLNYRQLLDYFYTGTSVKTVY